MTPEDLRQSRLHLWHQDGQPILTTEDAALWLDELGFCSFLPAINLPSLSQAVAGSDTGTPDAAALASAHQLAAQLLQQRAALPVLRQDHSMLAGEQFDALASSDVLPFLYCLRGDRDLKKAPKGSPLLQAVWSELQKTPLTVAEIATAVGREATEGAVLRSLRELWSSMRVVPLLDPQTAAAGSRWDTMQRTYPDAVRRGATTSQPLAISALVSAYLYAAVAATSEEVEDALGPLASRSRVREVLHALLATRQVKMLPIGRSSAYALTGGSAEVLDEIAAKRDSDTLRKSRAQTQSEKPATDRPPRKEWKPRAEGSSFPRKPFVKREQSDRPPRKEWKPRAEGSNFPRKTFAKREEGGRPSRPAERRPWKDRPASGPGDRKPWADGAGKTFGSRPPGRPFAGKSSGRPGGKPVYRKSSGGGPRAPRPAAAKRPFSRAPRPDKPRDEEA